MSGYIIISADAESVIAAHCQYKNVPGIRQLLSWTKNPDYSGCDKYYIEMTEWQKNFGLPEKYLIDVFGVERCMFASNLPVDGLYSD